MGGSDELLALLTKIRQSLVAEVDDSGCHSCQGGAGTQERSSVARASALFAAMGRRWEKLVTQTLSIVLILNQMIWSRGNGPAI